MNELALKDIMWSKQSLVNYRNEVVETVGVGHAFCGSVFAEPRVREWASAGSLLRLKTLV